MISIKMFSVLVVPVFLLTFFAKSAEAKVLPQSIKPTISNSVAKKSSVGGSIGVYPRLRGDRRALVVNFTNLQNATLVSYMLRYQTDTQEEGAMGGVNLTNSSATQELLFGTCSKNVCRYHTGIHDARLEVSYTSKSGKKYLKKYKIKI